MFNEEHAKYSTYKGRSMNNFNSAAVAALNTYLEAGHLVYSIAYNPATVTGDPEGAALAAGLTQYYREDTATLVEVIYTKASSGPVPH